jgi:hypothetical protein
MAELRKEADAQLTRDIEAMITDTRTYLMDIEHLVHNGKEMEVEQLGWIEETLSNLIGRTKAYWLLTYGDR